MILSWLPAGANGAYAAAYDALNHSVWVSSPSPLWYGVDRLFEYSIAGSASGRSWPHSASHSSGPADLAYNWNTGNLWIMNVNTGVANCIYEVAPDHGYTGAFICPGGGDRFRHLATRAGLRPRYRYLVCRKLERPDDPPFR